MPLTQHLPGVRNPQRLTRIKGLLADGMPAGAIAKRLHITASTVYYYKAALENGHALKNGIDDKPIPVSGRLARLADSPLARLADCQHEANEMLDSFWRRLALELKMEIVRRLVCRPE